MHVYDLINVLNSFIIKARLERFPTWSIPECGSWWHVLPDCLGRTLVGRQVDFYGPNPLVFFSPCCVCHFLLLCGNACLTDTFLTLRSVSDTAFCLFGLSFPFISLSPLSFYVFFLHRLRTRFGGPGHRDRHRTRETPPGCRVGTATSRALRAQPCAYRKAFGRRACRVSCKIKNCSSVCCIYGGFEIK